jgi:hypothetical protein
MALFKLMSACLIADIVTSVFFDLERNLSICFNFGKCSVVFS